MSDKCEVLMRRVPHGPDDKPIPAHAHMQLCGRPVLRDGLCVFHYRKRQIPPGEESRMRRALRKIGR